MKLLLDTHVLLWWLHNETSMAEKAFQAISSSTNVVFVSAATAWEIAIKKALGKLQAPDDLEAALRVNGFEPLPITLPHALLAGQLPAHHDDPFDRLLVAQATIENLTLVTRDPKQLLYAIHTLLA